MNIYNYLKKDHQTVANLFEQILSSKSTAKRKQLFEELINELLLHSEAENDTFYAALESHNETADLIEHAKKEHKEIKEYIKKLNALDIEKEKWIEQFGEFKHSVTHHVEEEEGNIFLRAKEVLSSTQANQLAIDMEAMKQELKAA
ncbi:MAG: hemerythrin domain-containing protein [Silvanigrellaceae bacterium]|nr:hemerythrin domain-containing protein [Silvanigrellaceae bacterium]